MGLSLGRDVTDIAGLLDPMETVGFACSESGSPSWVYGVRKKADRAIRRVRSEQYRN
jgi:hypothetical protein